MEGDAVESVGIEGGLDKRHQGADHGGDTSQPEEMSPEGNWERMSVPPGLSQDGKGPERGKASPASPFCLHMADLSVFGVLAGRLR